MARGFSILVLTWVFVAGCASPSGLRTYRVLDAATGEPIAGARVAIRYAAPFETPLPNTSDVTDEAGFTTLNIAELGRHYTTHVYIDGRRYDPQPAAPDSAFFLLADEVLLVERP